MANATPMFRRRSGLSMAGSRGRCGRGLVVYIVSLKPYFTILNVEGGLPQLTVGVRLNADAFPGEGQMLTLKSLIAASVVTLSAAVAVVASVRPASAQGPASAQEMRFFRIGTGSISGVYFPVGGLLGSIISSPPGSRPCESGGSCGVPGLVAVAQATLGSVANAEAIQSGELESALVQADVAYFAYKGLGPFAGKAPMTNLCAIANLYPEAAHVVVRADSPISTIGDLKGRRVSLDLAGSGTRAVALTILKGYGIDPGTLKQINSQIGPATDRIRNGRIDAFFFVGGFPAAALSRLARETKIRLLPVAGKAADAIRGRDPFMSTAHIPKGTYRNVDAVDTIAVGAQWLVSDKVDANTVYGIVSALWHPSSLRLLEHSVPAASQIHLKNALKGLTVPLHPGAARYYRSVGMLGAPKASSGTPKTDPKKTGGETETPSEAGTPR